MLKFFRLKGKNEIWKQEGTEVERTNTWINTNKYPLNLLKKL